MRSPLACLSRVVRPLVAALLLAGALPLRVAAQDVGGGAPALHRDTVRSDDGLPLTVWSKRPARRPAGTLLLLHGRTWSALPNFDLQVRGQQVSLMDALTRRGYEVFALDQRGHGATPRDSSQYLTPERAAEDALVVLRWISAHRPASGRPVLVGYSQGSLTAMLAATTDSTALSALVLYGFPLDLSDTTRRAMAESPARLERRATTIAGAEEDFLTPESTPAGVKAAYGRAAVAADPVRTDWRGERSFLAMDPGALRTPVLVLNGERDPYAGRAHLAGFVARVHDVDRAWVVLAHADHVAHLERQDAFANAIVAFLSRNRPAPH